MRIRHKTWAGPELAACPFFIDEPCALRGHWNERFGALPLELELGCGKGGFAADLAAEGRKTGLVAIDIKNEVLVLAKRRLEQLGEDASPALLTAHDIARFSLAFAPPDRFERIYINFPNPWPKNQHHKRRLTHPRQLAQYREVLPPGGEILFRTDDTELFEVSADYFLSSGFSLAERFSYSAGSPLRPALPATEHEEMFTAAGLPIHFIRAVRE